MKSLLRLVVGGALTLVALFGVWGLCFGLGAQLGLDEAAFRLELFKILWQFLLLAVLGGAVGLFFKIQEGEVVARRQNQEKEAAARRQVEDRERERRASRRDSLLRTRADLVRAYNQVKAIRRFLRASALHRANEQVVLRRDEYSSLVRRLIMAQLDFEYYVELIESDRVLIPEPKELKAQIEALEEYLSDLVSEFEDAWKIFAGNDQAPLEKFERLEEFVQKFRKGSPFDTKFKKPFHEALRLIEATADESS